MSVHGASSSYVTNMLLSRSHITQKFGSGFDKRNAAAHPGDVAFSVRATGFANNTSQNTAILTVFPSNGVANDYKESQFVGVVHTGTPLGADPTGAPECAVAVCGVAKLNKLRFTENARNRDARFVAGSIVYARPPLASDPNKRGVRNTAVVTNDLNQEPVGERGLFFKVGRALHHALEQDSLEVAIGRV